MTALVRLYPRAWRDRYETEFLALLGERPPRFGDRLDILLGALDAHLEPEVPESTPAPDATSAARDHGRPVAAILAGAGGILWTLTVATLLLAPVDADGYHDGMPALVFALLGQLALGGAALAVGAQLPSRGLEARLAGLVLLGSAGLMLFGWPWLALGIYGGFVGSMILGSTLVQNGGRVVGPVLVLASIVAFGLNTFAGYALLALPYALAWSVVAVWLLADHGPRRVATPPPA